MEYIILGLLCLSSRTIYQLRKRINEGLDLMYSCSTGSIQAAIKKLLKKGYISVEEVYDNGKLKKVYSITGEGRRYFNCWINAPIDSGAVKNPELAKIYFMGFAEKELRIELIERRITDLKKIYSELDKICAEGESKQSEFSENEIFFYQLQTAKYGRDFMNFNIGWYNRLLKEVKAK